MKTIYFYGIDNNKGGMETYAFNLIKDIISQTNEFKFHIISQFEDFSFRKELVNDCGCEFTIVPNRKKHPFKYSKAIFNVLKGANKNDVCQINLMSYRNIFLLHAVKKSKIKTIIVGHSTNTENKLNFFIHKIGSLHYKNFGTKIGNNEQIIKYLCGKNCNDYKIIELGINREDFKFNENLRTSLRNELQIDNNTFMIGQVGRICKQKNQIFSCKIMREINNPNIQLYFFGKKIDNKAIKYAKKHNLNNVHFMGEINNISSYYNAFDLFILPSIFESAGLVLYESLANSCQSIISNYVPTNGIKSKQLFIRKLNKKDWADEIIKQYNNQAKRQYVVNILPSHEKQISDYIALYKSL